MIGVVVPAHDEEAHIAACLQSLTVAARCPRLGGEEVRVVVVLDSCSDATEAIARSLGASTLTVQAKNVGLARAQGAELALSAGARWLAFTDADSVVGPGWISDQLALGSDAVCGTVEVRDWGAYGQRMRDHFENTYTDADGHRHVHGANLGVSATAYRGVGGFPALASSEDVALVDALRASGASIAWSAAPRVVTSARQHFRAPGGFGATLQRVAQAAALLPVAVGVASAGVAAAGVVP
jgi:glycosyltransferase involved in cell wall biosynthesis